MSKIALVTGASSGVGRNAALTLAKAGYTVVATGRRVDALEETANAAEGNVDPIASDVTDEASIDALFAAIKDKHGRLDVVFNNAGNNVGSINFAGTGTSSTLRFEVNTGLGINRIRQR